jgi:hypothetical protein
MRFGIHVQRSQVCRTLKPMRDRTNDTTQMMTMPTLTLTWSAFNEAIVCPATMAEMSEKPVTVAAFRSSGMVTRKRLRKRVDQFIVRSRKVQYLALTPRSTVPG